MAESCYQLHVREHDDFGLPPLSRPTAERWNVCEKCGAARVKLCPRCWRYLCVKR